MENKNLLQFPNFSKDDRLPFWPNEDTSLGVS